MALKIDANQGATAYHVNDGAVRFPYAVDARHAIASHPLEWRDAPWSQADADAARRDAADRHAKETAEAKTLGLPVPAPLPPPPPEPTPEEQAAIMEHAAAVAEASTRLNKFYAEQAEKKKIEDQVAADEALIAAPPPRPDPTARRPMSPAQIRKAAAQLTPQEEDALKAADDKAEQDKLAKSGAKTTF
jgi:hypothetical protein